MIKEELIKKITDANSAYRSGNPFISDCEYDDLLDDFRINYPDDYDKFRDSLNEGTMNSGRTKVKHTYILGSLEKIKNSDDKSLRDFVGRYIKNRMNISAKVDGISSEIVYKNGKISSASTRGDGYEGVDITDKIKYVKFVPNNINYSDEIHIRGELVILVDDMPDSSTNRRNICAGFMNKIDWNKDEISKVSFIPYTILGDKYTKTEQFNILNDLGFKTAWYENVDVNMNNLSEYLTSKAKVDHEYSCDGLVMIDEFAHNEPDVYRPKNSKAFKINELNSETRIIDVSWEGPTKDGRIQPVFILDPVEIGGAIISRASAHNLDVIESLGVKIGSKVEVNKANDIIPQVLSVIESDDRCVDIEYPTVCPCCGEKLVNDGPFLFCKNKECKDQTTYQVMHFIKKMNVENASFLTLQNFNISTISDLMKFQPNSKYKNEVKLYNELINKVFTKSDREIFCAMNFEGLSTILLNKIIDFFGWDDIKSCFTNTAGVWNIDRIKFLSIKSGALPVGVGDKTIVSFINGADDAFNKMKMITGDSRYNYIEKEIKTTMNKTDISVCFTGALNSIGRTEASHLAESHGWSVKSGVSKGLTYLVTNSDNLTTKMRKALEFGTKIINEEQFLNMLNDKSDLNNF